MPQSTLSCIKLLVTELFCKDPITTIHQNRLIKQQLLPVAINKTYLHNSLFKSIFLSKSTFATPDCQASDLVSLAEFLTASDLVSLRQALRHPFYTPARLGKIVAALSAISDRDCYLLHVVEAKDACVARHRQLYELLVAGNFRVQPNIETVVARFLDSFKERALLSAFIAPLRLVFQNDPEICENLEIHGKAFWAEVVEAVTDIACPLEDAVDLDGGWSWGARNLLAILAANPAVAEMIDRSIWVGGILGGPFLLEKIETHSSKTLDKFAFLLPFVSTGKASELSRLLADVRNLTVDPEIMRLLVGHVNLFLRFFADRDFVVRHLIDFIANQDATVRAHIGWLPDVFVFVSETGEVRYNVELFLSDFMKLGLFVA